MSRPFAWEASYPPGLDWGAPIVPTTVTALLDGAAERQPERTALVFRDWSTTYAGLRDAADRFAAGLLAAGLGGTHVALYLPNTPWHPIAFFGALRAGCVVVHLSPLDAPRELAHKLTDSGTRTLVTTDLGGLLAGALKLLDAGLVGRVILGEDAAFGGLPCEVPARPEVVTMAAFGAAPTEGWPQVTPDRLALLQYTGGTTGLPKGAMLTHSNLTASVASYGHWYDAFYGRPAGIERVLCVLPLFHIYALSAVLLLAISREAEIVLHTRFDATRVLTDIQRLKITSFPGVPTMWIAVANHPEVTRYDLTSLTRCSSGGAPLPVEVGARLERLTGHRLAGGWGMTETSPAGSNLPPTGPAKPGSIGLPLPGIEMDVVALDDPTRVLPPGETGEIRIRGANVTAGYWNRPQETAAAFAEGRFLTGDVGTMAPDGFFYLVDRRSDMILSGGFNVYPQVIEQAIYEHPSVAECCVIGIPDAYRGEAAKAVISLRPGATAPTLDALTAFLADRLGRHEMPAVLEVREALPRTPVGKLSRRMLRDEDTERQKKEA